VETFLQADRACERSRINDMENGEDQKNSEKTQEIKKIENTVNIKIFQEL